MDMLAIACHMLAIELLDCWRTVIPMDMLAIELLEVIPMDMLAIELLEVIPMDMLAIELLEVINGPMDQCLP